MAKVPTPPSPPPPPAASPGTSNQALLLGRYEVGKLLGHGTFAKVYHARNVRTNESVAIKVIDKEKILKSGLIAHIKREISILRRVRHPNIVQLFEVMATKAKIYFVMEYVRGGELFNKVAKGRLKEDAARKYFQQLISAVWFCHARGVFHRDLKPENLLLDENGNLKVSDFGLSAVSDQIRQDGLFHTFCGTPAYVAPEVLARKGYDAAKVDIWSCGVILFVLMAGYLPFHDQNIMAMYKKIYRGEFRCPRWFSPELTKLLTKLLDTNPETRFTIPEIMENRWFKKGFKHIKFYIEDDKVCNVDEDESDVESSSVEVMSESDSEFETRRKLTTTSLPRPASLNAFDIISFSPGFDLSGLFEEGGEGARFVSGAPVSKIISKLEEIAKVVSFTVRKKDCRVSLEGSRQGVKGPLAIAAEIFELTPKLVVVEVKKKGGDRREYEDFCNRELKPGFLKLMQEESEAAAAAASAPLHGHSVSLDSAQLARNAFIASDPSLDSTELPGNVLTGCDVSNLDSTQLPTDTFTASDESLDSTQMPTDRLPTQSSHLPSDTE
ncbi:CBL-interacting serine/threonine-protein kinase 12 [Turnera subulata]|uniref:non-specific serine/threonine protein kinase n=1 Tax=Turnera subulata TaxID=218843 RepID=A0A9Q0GJU1_9ROSI|nr:CBL-interacting serine/threonine-protein kinase 12 [Turnera subulata]